MQDTFRIGKNHNPNDDGKPKPSIVN